MNENTLATEMLKELKASSKRWFIAFIVVLALWFATIGIFIWYISLPVEEIETTEISDVSQDSGGGNNIVSGGDVNG